LLAKAVGRIWGVPLLRLDVGKVMTGLVGGSEGRMREVINQAEAMAPCILWLDEVEKSLSGTKSSNFSDGGTLSRVFGTLLTAMQDGLEGVTIIATANDITMLPPEFIRRFNEVFFVDLPTDEERWDILGIHLNKRGRKLASFLSNKEQFLEASKEFTGAEIEKAVKDAIAASYYDNKKELQFSHILDALQDTKPIAKLMFDKIEQIRKTAIGQYRFSSSLAEKSMGKTSTKKKKVTKTSTDDLLATNSKEEDNTTNRLLF
jgi:SpoVK/Ycf46/Vps4 family AAA+-type ATPase